MHTTWIHFLQQASNLIKGTTKFCLQHKIRWICIPQSFHTRNQWTIFLKRDNTYLKVTILNQPVDPNTNTYAVQEVISGAILDVPHKELLNANPTRTPDNQQFTLRFSQFTLAVNGAKRTLFLPNKMKCPKQGTLQFKSNEWSFHLGLKLSSNNLNEIPSNIESLAHNHKLFKGWKRK